MKIPALWSAVVALMAASALSSCNLGHKKKNEDPHRAKSFQERTMKPDTNKMSQFEKKFDTAALGDRGAMKLMGKKAFSTSDYKGNITFNGKKTFKTSSFAQAGKTSPVQKQESTLGSKKSNVADKSYKTTDSLFGSKKAKGNDMVFQGSHDVYKTSAFGPGTKSIEDNKRPFFKPKGELEETKNAYSEQEVKALLNRN